MPNRIFFLSHSSRDQRIVKKIAVLLGKELCWLYEWEVKPGESVFKFDRGIADSRIFVLFWSSHATSSQWVSEEVSQARIRMFRDNGFRLVVVRLDDTSLPDSLAHRVHINGNENAELVAESLRNVQTDLTSEEVFYGHQALKDFFQDRQGHIDSLERLAFDQAYSGIMVLGLDGMGKTSFVKRAIALLFSHLTPIWIDLRIASTPIRVLSTICGPLSISIDIEKAAAEPKELWRSRILPEISQSERMFVVLDNLGIESGIPSQTSGTAGDLVRTICQDLAELNKLGNPNAILISRMAPDLPQATIAKFGRLTLGGLDTTSMIRALRYHLGYASHTYDSKKVALLAGRLRGYPLTISLVAMRVAEQGIDVVLEDKSLLREMLFDMAQDLFSGLPILPNERELLVLIATSMQPLSPNNLRDVYGDDWTKVGRVAKKQLLDPTAPGYRLHRILSDYVLESMATANEIMQTHARLATLFRNEWKRVPEETAASAQYGSLAYFHTIAAGNVEEAKQIKFAYLAEAKDAAVELYRHGQYKIALEYLENARRMEKKSDPTYDFYYALSLSRLDRAKEALPIMQELVDRFPNAPNYHHALGTVFRRLKKHSVALDSFRKAVATSRGARRSVPLASLADLLYDRGSIEEARSLSAEALDADPHDSWVVSVAVKVLQKSGDLPEAVKVLTNAIRRSPTNTHLHFRAGMILKQMGQLTEAKSYLERATEDPALAFAFTALADVHLLLGNKDKAEEVLEKFPGSKTANASYLTTKANILRHREDFGGAEKLFRKALKLEPNNPVHHGGLAQLRFEQAQDALLKGEKQMASVYVNEAKINVTRGLEKDKENDTLLTIKHALGQFETRLGFD